MKKECAAKTYDNAPFGKVEFMENALATMGEIPALVLSSGNNVDFAIDESLAKIGALFSASRVYVMLDEKDGRYLRNTHEWVSGKIGPAMFSWPLYDYDHDIPSLKTIIAENKLFFAHSRELPSDLNHVMSKQGVLSLIIAAITRDQNRIGLIGVDFCESECEYCSDFSYVLPYFANIIGLALERKQFQLLRSKLANIRETMLPLEQYLNGHHTGEPTTSRPAKPTTLLDSERRIIVETLELYNGNKLKTAKHLGLTWPSLDRRCKKLGIDVKRR